MGIFSRFSSEFVDIIEWVQRDSETMVYRFPRYRNEIKYGAKLTVREGQTAILVNEGKVADVFLPGIYELKTANLPILSTLQNWQYGFESPFKAEVYFFNTTDFLDLKWGTKQAVTLADAKFGIVRLRAFGSYTMRIEQPEVFLKKLVGTDGNFEITEVSEQLTNAIVTRFPEVLATSNISMLELPARYGELADAVKARVSNEFNAYGLEVGKIYVENISLPEGVQKVLDEKTGMNIIGEDLNNYTRYQAAQGLGKGNDGSSMASAGVGMALGVEMGKSLTDNLTDKPDTAADEPPPLPDTARENRRYYLMILGERKGPMTLDTLHQYVQAGNANEQTLVWFKGLPQWQPLSTIEEAGLTPPPLKKP